MSVRDFPPRPQGAQPDSVPYQNWLDTLGQRQNIDLLQELTSVASGDEVAIFDVSETGNVKTKKATVANIGLAMNTGMYGAIGWDCANNATTPNTQYDLSASQLVLINGSGGIVYDSSPGSVTVNISTAGPAANGRDQSGAFSTSSWVHFYRIYGSGQSDAGIASTSATAPTLPSGYTHYAYAGAVYFNGSSALVSTAIKGPTAFYRTRQNCLLNGAATSTTSVAIGSFVPPNALSFTLNVQYLGGSAASGQLQITTNFEVISGVNYGQLAFNIRDSSTTGTNQMYIPTTNMKFPNISQQFRYYHTVLVGTSPLLTTDVFSYDLPNGG